MTMISASVWPENLTGSDRKETLIPIKKSAQTLWLALLLSLVLVLVTPNKAKAANKTISQTTKVRDYRVYGTTPGELLSYMRRRPFRGDNGPAMANIRPRYDLRTKTLSQKGGCRLSQVSLAIRFTMTLPKSVQKTSQSNKTRKVWNSFRAYAKQHEETHRRIYMQCARKFVSDARKLRVKGSCSKLSRKVRQMLKEHEKACDRRHLAFDRRDFRRVPGLALMRQGNRELQRARKTTKVSSNRRKTSTAKAQRRTTWFAKNRRK